MARPSTEHRGGAPSKPDFGLGGSSNLTYNAPSSGVTYKPNGNIGFGNDSVNGDWSYTYDDFNRVLTAQKTGVSFSYVYDRFGNRWQQNGGPGPQPQYTFDTYNRIASGNGVSYDAAGNVINDGFHTYTYDAENRMISVDGGTTASYVYDLQGRRARAATGSETQDFAFDLQGKAITAIRASDGVWVRSEIWSPIGYLATYMNSTTYFNHSDWLGTVRARSNVSGGPAETYTSLPFGDGLSSIGVSPIHFTEQERDAETGLDHFWYRQYSSTEGRWLSPDPAGLAAADPADPQSWNRYASSGPSSLPFCTLLGRLLPKRDRNVGT